MSRGGTTEGSQRAERCREGPVTLAVVAVQLLERRARPASRRAGGLVASLRHLDLLLVAAALSLAGIGLVMVYSVTDLPPDPTSSLKHQIVYVLLGVALMVVMTLFDYHRLEEWAVVIYVASFLALLAVRAAGHSIEGASREIVVGPLAIQPSEFAVVAIIIVVAVFLQRNDEALGPRNLARLALLVAPQMALILFEPDLGTTMISAVVVVTMFVVGGVRLRYLALLALGILCFFVLGAQIHLLHGYQLERLSGFLHQGQCNLPAYSGSNACYQLENAKAAIGAGGLAGTGLFHGALTNSGFVPFAYADMIFSAIGEQLGFVGSLLVLGLFALIALRCVRAIQTARDTLGRLICAGAPRLCLVLGLSEHRDERRHHADHGDPAPLRLLRRLGAVRHLRCDRPRRERRDAAGAGTMSDAAAAAGKAPPVQYCPLELVDVLVVLPESHARLTLREVEGERRLLTIPIGLPEANAIVLARDRLQTPRPLTHELFADALSAFGVVIETVRITAGEGQSYRAELVVSGPTGPKVLDCRPSDGIALALRQALPAPVTASVALLDELGAPDG